MRCWSSSKKRPSKDAARMTDEKAGSEDRKHTPGGVFVAIESDPGVVNWQRRGSGYFDPGD